MKLLHKWATLNMAAAPAYRRILLKLSGEALMGEDDFGINPDVIARTATDVAALSETGVEIGLVIGGGNIFRGAGLAGGGMDRVTGDHMGMLATVMNALAMRDALSKVGIDARVLSALNIEQACENYTRYRAVEHLEKGRIAILAAGTGNPFFTTDTAACLRAIEIGADLVIKATKVNGIYSDDPMTNPDAEFYPELTFARAISEDLKVMDTAAMVLCRDNDMPLRVLNVNESGSLMRMVLGENVGTLVSN